MRDLGPRIPKPEAKILISSTTAIDCTERLVTRSPSFSRDKLKTRVLSWKAPVPLVKKSKALLTSRCPFDSYPTNEACRGIPDTIQRGYLKDSIV
jgi:hypothetical protein